MVIHKRTNPARVPSNGNIWPVPVELTVEQFAKEIWPAKGFTLVEVFFEFAGNPDQLQNLIDLFQLFRTVICQGFFLKRTFVRNISPRL